MGTVLRPRGEQVQHPVVCGGQEAAVATDWCWSESKYLNPRPAISAKPIVASCDICNIELNSVEELHIKQNHSADDDDESGCKIWQFLVCICSPDRPKIPPSGLPDPLQDEPHDRVQGRGQVCGLCDLLLRTKNAPLHILAKA